MEGLREPLLFTIRFLIAFFPELLHAAPLNGARPRAAANALDTMKESLGVFFIFKNIRYR
jgi:hypothetical protein